MQNLIIRAYLFAGILRILIGRSINSSNVVPSRSNILEENKLIELADGKLIITFYFEHIKAFYSLEKEEDNSQVGF